MPLEDATNCWTEAHVKIAEGLAHSARWREVLQADDVAEALQKTFGQQVAKPANGNAYTKEELQELRAYCQIYSAESRPFGLVRGGSNYLQAYGSATVFLERLVIDAAVLDGEVPYQADRWLENRVGDAMLAMCEWMADNGPHIRGCEITDGPGFNSSDSWQSGGCWQGVEFRVDFGLVEL